MTDEKMTLFELIQQADSTDFLKELAEITLQRLMESMTCAAPAATSAPGSGPTIATAIAPGRWKRAWARST